jgi:hypothetical protein
LATIELQIAAKARGMDQRTVMPPLSNLAVRDVETLVHPYTNLARFRERRHRAATDLFSKSHGGMHQARRIRHQ